VNPNVDYCGEFSIDKVLSHQLSNVTVNVLPNLRFRGTRKSVTFSYIFRKVQELTIIFLHSL